MSAAFAPTLGIDLALHGYWYLGRAGGFVAYGVLFVSVVFGLGVSSRLFDGLLPRAWLFELHRYLSLLLLAVVLFHALIMLPDPYAGFTPDELLLPFRSHVMRLPTSLGVLTLYGLTAVTASFFVTRWIGQRSWRALHYLTFLLFVAATVHSIWAGTDSDSIAVRLFYLSLGVCVLFLVFYRILALRGLPTAAARAAAAPPSRLAASDRPIGSSGRPAGGLS